MSSSDPSPRNHSNLALWITVIIEGLMIVAGGAYNIYEVRRNSQLVQSKIQGLSEFSAHQGAKVDRMLTAFESYFGKKITPEEVATKHVPAVTGERLDKAISRLEALKTKKAESEAPSSN